MEIPNIFSQGTIYSVHEIKQLVGGWTNPFEKYDRQIGSSPQGSGWKYKMFEVSPPRNVSPFQIMVILTYLCSVSRVFFLTPTIMVQFEVSPPSVPRRPQHLPGTHMSHPAKPPLFAWLSTAFRCREGGTLPKKTAPGLKRQASKGGWFPGQNYGNVLMKKLST